MNVWTINKPTTARINSIKWKNAIIAATITFYLQGMWTKAETVTVDGSANIFAAGRSTLPAPGGGSGGTFPAAFNFAPGQWQSFRFPSISGTNTLTVGLGFNGPDGTPSYNTDIDSYEGISGIIADKAGFLVGVFLGPDEPTNPSPPRIDFSATGLGTTFDGIAPEIGQTFFIGDGVGSTPSAIQEFLVPPAATRLFLGFADAFGYSGQPGHYQDNGGLLTVTNELSPLLAIYTAVEITWISQTGVQYQVQSSPQSLTTTWTNLGNPILGNGLTNAVFDSTRANGQRFYRVTITE